MRRLGSIILVVLLSFGVSMAADDGGTQSPFSFGAGARELSLGGAALSVSDATTAPFWNASRLADAQQYEFGGFHSTLYDSDVAYQYLGIAIPTLDYGVFGLGIFRLGVSGIEKRDAGNLLLGETDDNRLGFNLAYGRFIAGYAVGMSLSLEHHSIDDYTATSSPGMALSVSRRFAFGSTFFDHLIVTAEGRNLLKPGMKLSEETVEYPTSFDLGVALGLVPGADWGQEATLCARLTKIEDIDPRLAVGVEYSFKELLHLRGGVREGKLSFGVGLQYKLLRFDYALVDRDLGSLHMFTLTTSFGTPVNERRLARTRERESQFNDLMNTRLGERNRQTVGQLVDRGRELLDKGDLVQAATMLDRALFLARGNDMDTTAIYEMVLTAHERLDRAERVGRFDKNLKSAQERLARKDYLGARHFADLALSDVSNSEQAQRILEQADAAIERTVAKDELIRERLWDIDSLLSYGYVDDALELVRSLRQFADENASVRLAIKRVEFEHLRETASVAFVGENFKTALATVDSALVLFPDHQWCLDLRRRILDDMHKPSVDTVAVAPKTAVVLSDELRKEIEGVNKAAQDAFENGRLGEAIANWERVERLAPDYQSVRKYLINAYKFVGIELYGKNQLQEAVATWKKAARLDPDNEAIQDYIKRTETEILKLRELSYEQQ